MTHIVVKALGNLYKLSEENPFLKFILSLLMWASVDKEAEQLGVAVPRAHCVSLTSRAEPPAGLSREQGHTPLEPLPPSAGQQGRDQRPQDQWAEVGLLAGVV